MPPYRGKFSLLQNFVEWYVGPLKEISWFYFCAFSTSRPHPHQSTACMTSRFLQLRNSSFPLYSILPVPAWLHDLIFFINCTLPCSDVTAILHLSLRIFVYHQPPMKWRLITTLVYLQLKEQWGLHDPPYLMKHIGKIVDVPILNLSHPKKSRRVLKGICRTTEQLLLLSTHHTRCNTSCYV
jgi:hypothetical protein